MNIVEHVSLLYAEESSGYMPSSGITGSSVSDMPSFLRNRQTDFQSVFSIDTFIPPNTFVKKDTYSTMFIAALFVVARSWKEPRCPSMEE